MRTIKKIGIHHFGGTKSNPKASTKHLTFQDIDKAHKLRWPELKSSLGFWIGYNVIIFPDGTYKQFRKIGEETAAATGSNFDSFHICLAGNFTVGGELPTEAQKATLQKILKAVLAQNLGSVGLLRENNTVLDTAISRIYPHRILQPNHTECYGLSLSNDWGRKLVMSEKDEEAYKLSLIKQIQLLIMQLQDLINKKKFGRLVLGSDDNRDYCGLLDI